MKTQQKNQGVTTKKLLILEGPTAVGKTDFSIELAQLYDCPILSADSRQCYRELGVATAKPSSEMLALVEHFFIDSHSIHQPVSVAEYEKYALEVLDQIYLKSDFCILSGGSGLYIKAITDGLDEIPEVPGSFREDLEDRYQTDGLESLVDELRQLDPITAGTIDRNNSRRVIRALEVTIATGKPFSSYKTGVKHERPFQSIKIGLSRDRQELYDRIDLRVEQMVEQGLFQEARALFNYRHLKPLQTLGYQEIFGFLEGSYDQEHAIELLKRNSRRYAKRQFTWFKKDQEIQWFPANDLDSIRDFLRQVAPV